MFKSLTVRGATGSIVWGYRPAAILRTWAIARSEPGTPWQLTARVQSSDVVALRQLPLIFTAPRRGGLWCWPVVPKTLTIEALVLRATLGPPEF